MRPCCHVLVVPVAGSTVLSPPFFADVSSLLGPSDLVILSLTQSLQQCLHAESAILRGTVGSAVYFLAWLGERVAIHVGRSTPGRDVSNAETVTIHSI